MTPIQKFQASLILMQLLAFVLGMLFEYSLEKRRRANEEE